MKYYFKPDCEELLFTEEGILCQSTGGATEGFTYDPSDPRNNYNW